MVFYITGLYVYMCVHVQLDMYMYMCSICV